jgi:hypothetical protein
MILSGSDSAARVLAFKPKSELERESLFQQQQNIETAVMK